MDRLLNAHDVDTLEAIFATGSCGGDPSAHALMIAKARALLADRALWQAQAKSATAVCARKEKELAEARLEVERLQTEQDEIHSILGKYEWDSVSLAGGVAALAEAWKGDAALTPAKADHWRYKYGLLQERLKQAKKAMRLMRVAVLDAIDPEETESAIKVEGDGEWE